MRLILIGALLASSLAHATSASPAFQLPKKVAAMTPDQFKARTTLSDDALDTVAVLSTEGAFKHRRGGPIGTVFEDNFIRAFVDKKTGATTFQVHQWVRYNRGWRNYYQANFATPAGPVATDVVVIGRNAGLCPDSEIVADCWLTEHFWFPVDESTLRAAAVGSRLREGESWRFKFKAQRGSDRHDALSRAEIAGLLAAVDAYKARQRIR